ncbi:MULTISPECIES: YbaB/EbfC family nucleoid-associated protein [unclassified Prochlorococcus]|uniref:YbaB/EbfC family nucleoid-associated protein n=1 Tax=unclassified Prochlorococcus TaxID=2627481 RepID=UPI0005339B8B|nr:MULTISPECIES: YbaB/EbfC family nucleoid-associated protein [unclassified Prochlorococcus]KGG18095.1 hypothetical protein EV07_0007 [Prochlorococcus sp. MIT 0603]
MAAFGLPNFGQITEAFKKAQQIQQDAQKLQEELEEMELEGTNEDRTVTVFVSGNQKPMKVMIEDSLLKENKEIIESAILEAMQVAHETSTTNMKNKMQELTGGLNLNLPGITNED